MMEDDKPVTLGQVIEHTLLFGSLPEDTPQTKYARWQLAKRVSSSQETDLPDSMIETIKKLAAPLYSTSGIGALYHALNNPSNHEEKSNAD